MKTTSTLLRSLIIAASILSSATWFASAQPLIYNGSFEVGTDPGSDFIPVQAVNSTTISGWTVSSGNVDYIGGRWSAGAGARSVDMNSTVAGTILQTVGGLTPGADYLLSFLLAASPDAPAGATRSVLVSAGSLSQTFSAIGTASMTNPGWSERSWIFSPSSSSIVLSFSSLNTGAWGSVIDGVSLTPVPEPGMLSLGLAGMATALFFRTKQTK